MRDSLIAQLVKNPPAMQEILVWFPGGEDPLEKEEATHSSILRLPWWFSWWRIRPAMQETRVRSLGGEDPLEKGKATHSGILAWGISWTVQSVRLQRVGHDWATLTFFSSRRLAENRELCSMSFGSLDGRGVWGEWIRVYLWLRAFRVHLKLSQHC